MNRWLRRLKHWSAVVRRFSNAEPLHRKVQALVHAAYKMLRALASGPVPASIAVKRMKICARCPIRTSKDWVCFKKAYGIDLGCRCDLNFLVLTAAPYREGCYLKTLNVVSGGWHAYEYHSLFAKLKATYMFFNPTKK